jgi:hypothetical protein
VLVNGAFLLTGPGKFLDIILGQFHNFSNVPPLDPNMYQIPVGNVADEVVARAERHGVAVGQHPSEERRLLTFTSSIPSLKGGYFEKIK